MANAAHAAARYESVADMVGRTPLVRLTRVSTGLSEHVEVYGKLEYFNPGGSVKDRAARQILLDALARGDLGEGRALLDSTSGNTGVAYAMLGASLGVPVTLVMPSNVSQARKDIIAAYGAEIVFSDPLEGSDGAIRMARDMVANDGDRRYWYADQYSNPSNPRAHELTTGPELIEQTGGRISHFVAGLGTTGTIVGTSRALRAWRPGVQIVAVEPDAAFHGLEGLKHLPSSLVPPIYTDEAHDRTLRVDTDSGWDMAERLAVDEGLAVGWSSGAAAVAALTVARELEHGVVVALFPDHADRYMAPPRSRTHG